MLSALRWGAGWVHPERAPSALQLCAAEAHGPRRPPIIPKIRTRGFRARGLGYKVWGSGCRVEAEGLQLQEQAVVAATPRPPSNLNRTAWALKPSANRVASRQQGPSMNKHMNPEPNPKRAPAAESTRVFIIGPGFGNQLAAEFHP